MYETVIFDWDGTLADSRKAILIAFHRSLLEEVRRDTNDEVIERRIGIGAALTFREILRALGVPADEALVKKLVEKKIEAEIDLAEQIPLFNGAVELLTALKGKVKLALASMNNRAVIKHLLKTTGTEAFFEVVVTADEVINPKPNPEIFLKCAEKTGSQPQKCMVVEDSIFGVQAAKAAGMGCVAVLTGVYSKQELAKAKPDLIIDSLSERKAILNLVLK